MILKHWNRKALFSGEKKTHFQIQSKPFIIIINPSQKHIFCSKPITIIPSKTKPIFERRTQMKENWNTISVPNQKRNTWIRTRTRKTWRWFAICSFNNANQRFWAWFPIFICSRGSENEFSFDGVMRRPMEEEEEDDLWCYGWSCCH